jgi:hypothetical protein
MTANKKYENLWVYIIGPMEDDDEADREFGHIEAELVKSGIPLEQIMNPCRQEKLKTGFDVMDSNREIKKLRVQGKDEEVDRIYRAIWRVDIENVRKADILIANIPPGTHYVGTTREATIAITIVNIDLVRDNFTDEQKRLYEDVVRPGLKQLGFPQTPIHLITPAKTRVNGTFVHGLVRPSGGITCKTIGELIEYLKETYK